MSLKNIDLHLSWKRFNIVGERGAGNLLYSYIKNYMKAPKTSGLREIPGGLMDKLVRALHRDKGHGFESKCKLSTWLR